MRSDTGLRFRTAADVRAIPNAKWEQWLRNDTVPFRAFAAEHGCQMALRNVLRATLRRVDA